jgi:hypothetical protein
MTLQTHTTIDRIILLVSKVEINRKNIRIEFGHMCLS